MQHAQATFPYRVPEDLAEPASAASPSPPCAAVRAAVILLSVPARDGVTLRAVSRSRRLCPRGPVRRWPVRGITPWSRQESACQESDLPVVPGASRAAGGTDGCFPESRPLTDMSRAEIIRAAVSSGLALALAFATSGFLLAAFLLLGLL